MSSINPLRFGVTGNQYYKYDSSEESKQSAKKEEKAPEQKQKEVNSNTVFSYLAAQNADIVPASATKTLNVSKYVTPEQEARIADFMKGFEADFDDFTATATDEFPDLSDGAASELALAYINSAYEK